MLVEPIGHLGAVFLPLRPFVLNQVLKGCIWHLTYGITMALRKGMTFNNISEFLVARCYSLPSTYCLSYVLTDPKAFSQSLLIKKTRHSVHYRGEEYVYLLVISLNQNDQNSEVTCFNRNIGLYFYKENAYKAYRAEYLSTR